MLISERNLTGGSKAAQKNRPTLNPIGGNESNDYLLARRAGRQVKTGSNSDACAIHI